MDSYVFEIYTQNTENDENQNVMTYSLNQLIQMDNDFLNDKTFKTIRREHIEVENGNQFKYLKIKCQELNEDHNIRVMEITDVKELIERQERERKVVMLMNATVSHEMRNPLNAINA